MNEHDLDAALRTRFTRRARADAPSSLLSRVLAIPARSPHRRSWLSRLISGGPFLMFSATKVFAALGILAVSGALLTTQLTQQPAAVPAGATITFDQSPNYIDGTVEIVEEPELGETEIATDYYEWTAQPVTLSWSSNDARLSGDGTAVEHGLQHFSTYTGVRTTWLTIANDGGSWSGPFNEFSRVDGGQGFAVLTGHDGYDGLSAYLSIGPDNDQFDGEGVVPVRGVIFPAAPPTMPTVASE